MLILKAIWCRETSDQWYSKKSRWVVQQRW